MEEAAHLLELRGEAATLLFVGVGEDGEVWSSNLEPVRVRIACQGREGNAKKESQENSLVHGHPRVWERMPRLEEKNACGATTKEDQVLVDEAMEKRSLNGV